MPNSEAHLTLESTDPLAELMLLDPRFKAVLRGVGRVEGTLPVGLYLARASAGNQTTERAVALRDDATVTLPFVNFDSPIPLSNTRTSHEYHQAPVSAALGAASGHGGFLLCVRDAVRTGPFDQPEAAAAYRRAYAGLRLLDAEGACVIDFDTTPDALRLQDGLLLHQASLPAALYQLEHQGSAGPPLRVPVLVREGLTAQWYALITRSPNGWQPDTANAAMAYGWRGAPFRAESPELRLAERARMLLARGGTLAPSPLLDDMLRAKFEYPMLGVLGAHLLLREKAPRFDLIDTVLGNTAGMLGPDFPDVAALRAKFALLTGDAPVDTPIDTPPLMRRSWDYLLEAAEHRPALVPPEGRAARLARHIVSNGIWMAWRPAPAEAAAPRLLSISSALGGALGGKLGGLFGRLTPPAPEAEAASPGARARAQLEHLATHIDWDALIAHARRHAAPIPDNTRSLMLALRQAKSHVEGGGKIDAGFVEQIARTLGVPLSGLEQGIEALVRVLGAMR